MRVLHLISPSLFPAGAWQWDMRPHPEGCPMKIIMPLVASAIIAGCATAPPECADPATAITSAEIRYSESYASGVEWQAVRRLACYKHHNQAQESAEPCYGQPLEMGGLALSRDIAGDSAIAQLYAFTFDAGDSYERHCISLIRGKQLLPALRALLPKQARQKCLTLFAQPNLLYIAHDFPKAAPDMVCHSEAEIRENVDRIIERIEAGETCEPWNMD